MMRRYTLYHLYCSRVGFCVIIAHWLTASCLLSCRDSSCAMMIERERASRTLPVVLTRPCSKFGIEPTRPEWIHVHGAGGWRGKRSTRYMTHCPHYSPDSKQRQVCCLLNWTRLFDTNQQSEIGRSDSEAGPRHRIGRIERNCEPLSHRFTIRTATATTTAPPHSSPAPPPGWPGRSSVAGLAVPSSGSGTLMLLAADFTFSQRLTDWLTHGWLSLGWEISMCLLSDMLARYMLSPVCSSFCTRYGTGMYCMCATYRETELEPNLG